jgi:hypothetical protein
VKQTKSPFPLSEKKEDKAGKMEESAAAAPANSSGTGGFGDEVRKQKLHYLG